MIAGKDKGKSSTVARVLREENRVVVEGLNMMKKHIKAKKSGEKGSIVSIAMPIHASNVKLADKSTKVVKAEKPAKKTTKKEVK